MASTRAFSGCDGRGIHIVIGEAVKVDVRKREHLKKFFFFMANTRAWLLTDRMNRAVAVAGGDSGIMMTLGDDEAPECFIQGGRSFLQQGGDEALESGTRALAPFLAQGWMDLGPRRGAGLG